MDNRAFRISLGLRLDRHDTRDGKQRELVSEIYSWPAHAVFPLALRRVVHDEADGMTVHRIHFPGVNGCAVCDCGSIEFRVGIEGRGEANHIRCLECVKCGHHLAVPFQSLAHKWAAGVFNDHVKN